MSDQASNDTGDTAVVEPGQTCPTCQRRVKHRKKESSPVTKTFSYRVPVDEAEAHAEVAEAAAHHIGVFERPYWRYHLDTLAYAVVLQDASLAGIGQRSPYFSESPDTPLEVS